MFVSYSYLRRLPRHFSWLDVDGCWNFESRKWRKESSLSARGVAAVLRSSVPLLEKRKGVEEFVPNSQQTPFLLLPPSHKYSKRKDLIKFKILSLKKGILSTLYTLVLHHCSAIFICAFEWYIQVIFALPLICLESLWNVGRTSQAWPCKYCI